MSRHVVRAEHLRRRLHRARGMSFVDDALVLPRTVAASTIRVVVGPAGPGLQGPRLRAA